MKMLNPTTAITEKIEFDIILEKKIEQMIILQRKTD
jgi:hypothetical protein